MKEYQQAWGMPASQHFFSDLETSWNSLWFDDRCKTFLSCIL